MSIILPLMFVGIIFLLLGIMIYNKLSGTDYMALRFDGSDTTLCEAEYDGMSKLYVSVPSFTGVKKEMYIVIKNAKPSIFLRQGVGKRKPLFFVVPGELMARAMVPPSMSDELREIIDRTIKKIDMDLDSDAEKVHHADKMQKLTSRLKLKLDESALFRNLLTPAQTIDNRALCNIIDGGLARKLIELQDVIPELLMGGAYGLLIGLAVASAMGTEALQNPISQAVMMGAFLTIVMYFYFYERRKGVI